MKGWIESFNTLAVRNGTPIDGEVIGWIAPFGIVEDGEQDFVTFDGSEWRDRAGRTCTVTHWKKIAV